MKVLVLYGGDNSEREISIRSSRAVIDALKTAGHMVSTFDPREGMDQLSDHLDVDVIFPVLHGKGYEDGEIQKELDKTGIPYLGSGSEACALTFDKVAFKKKVINSGVLTPKFELVDRRSYKQSELKDAPHVLKPNDEGSSVDTYVVRDISQLPYDPNEIFSTRNQMLIEELIEGPEITVPILDHEALQVIEIVPPDNGEFDYENKYNGKSKELCPPENVDSTLQKKAQDIALQAHQLAGARHLSRSDFMINSRGDIYFLELNTLPGMTDQSLFPIAAKQAGYDFPALMDKLIELCLR